MARFGLTLTACLLFGFPTFACSVPVFRYALDVAAGPIRTRRLSPGAAEPRDREAVGRFETAGRRANVRVTDADLARRMDPDLQAVWDRDGNAAALPRLVLRYPDSGSQVPSVWAGPLSADPKTLFDSPARRAVFDRLTTGHAGVVVLLLSGNTAADKAARNLLRTELPRIASRIDLPRPTEDRPQVQSELPLWIDFPVVEVPRTPSEEILARILLGSEDGLAVVRGPIVFPVFGAAGPCAACTARIWPTPPSYSGRLSSSVRPVRARSRS